MNENRPTIDQNFLEMCKVIAKRSRDPSTKVGAVIVGPDNEIRSTGYNCFPRGINDNVEERFERPEKYHWFEHAERNAIYNAARVGVPLDNCRIYIPWLPCIDCARAIVQVGIRYIITENIEPPDRWKDSIRRSMELFTEAGISLYTEGWGEDRKQEVLALTK